MSLCKECSDGLLGRACTCMIHETKIIGASEASSLPSHQRCNFVCMYNHVFVYGLARYLFLGLVHELLHELLRMCTISYNYTVQLKKFLWPRLAVKRPSADNNYFCELNFQLLN